MASISTMNSQVVARRKEASAGGIIRPLLTYALLSCLPPAKESTSSLKERDAPARASDPASAAASDLRPGQQALGGGVIAATAWLVGSALLSWYLANFANYDATYGSLGAAIGMMIWMWMSSIVILVGAELNSEIEHQTAQDSTTVLVSGRVAAGDRVTLCGVGFSCCGAVGVCPWAPKWTVQATSGRRQTSSSQHALYLSGANLHLPLGFVFRAQGGVVHCVSRYDAG